MRLKTIKQAHKSENVVLSFRGSRQSCSFQTLTLTSLDKLLVRLYMSAYTFSLATHSPDLMSLMFSTAFLNSLWRPFPPCTRSTHILPLHIGCTSEMSVSKFLHFSHCYRDGEKVETMETRGGNICGLGERP